MEPKVSVLLTCYNHFAYLPTALESVRKQTHGNFEIIAIDDGSTDETRKWLAKQSDLQCVFNERNLGTYATLNEGLRRASGDFVAVLNDDDVWAPDKLRLQLELFERHPSVGLVHTNGGFINGDGAPIEGSPLGFEFPRTETGDVYYDLFYQNKIIASASLIRMVCFKELGQFNPQYFGSGDWEMWLRIAARFQIGFVDEPLTLYRVHGANASHKLERIWKDDQMLREWIETLLPKEQSDRARRALSHNAACLGTVRKLNGDPAGSRAAFALSIRRNPGRLKSYLRYLSTFLPVSAFRRLI